MDFTGMPKSFVECAAMLEAHEAETGYKIKTLFVGTTLRRDFIGGGYSICEQREGRGHTTIEHRYGGGQRSWNRRDVHDKPIVTFGEDGRIKINVGSAASGRSAMARTARINAALPPGYRLDRHQEGGVAIGYMLTLAGKRVDVFSNTYTFTPEEKAAA